MSFDSLVTVTSNIGASTTCYLESKGVFND